MTEQVVSLFTFGSICLTIVKVYRKHTAWYWNLAPAVMGACALAWVAYFVA